MLAKAGRKKTISTSPHFQQSLTQISVSPTCDPSVSAKVLDKKSKVSIIETMAMPSSLPHFRPTSPEEFGLIQEKLRHDPWKMLVAVIFLNVTTGKQAIPLLGQLFERWPTPEALSRGIYLKIPCLPSQFRGISCILISHRSVQHTCKTLNRLLHHVAKPSASTGGSHKAKGIGKLSPHSHFSSSWSEDLIFFWVNSVDGRLCFGFVANVLCGTRRMAQCSTKGQRIASLDEMAMGPGGKVTFIVNALYEYSIEPEGTHSDNEQDTCHLLT